MNKQQLQLAVKTIINDTDERCMRVTNANKGENTVYGVDVPSLNAKFIILGNAFDTLCEALVNYLEDNKND